MSCYLRRQYASKGPGTHYESLKIITPLQKGIYQNEFNKMIWTKSEDGSCFNPAPSAT